MNYLAHAYLSFNHPSILVGNMVSDFVKGRKKFEYSEDIQKGISLHRAIDEFTDFHRVTAFAKSFFRRDYGLYSGPFIDIVYDHVWANDESEFPKGSLLEFTEKTYAILNSQFSALPLKFQYLFPIMKTQNWLYNYRHRWGIRNSFEGLVRRAAYMYESETAFRIFETNYMQLENCFAEFFPELKEFARLYFDKLVIGGIP